MRHSSVTSKLVLMKYDYNIQSVQMVPMNELCILLALLGALSFFSSSSFSPCSSYFPCFGHPRGFDLGDGEWSPSESINSYTYYPSSTSVQERIYTKIVPEGTAIRNKNYYCRSGNFRCKTMFVVCINHKNKKSFYDR